MSLSRLLFRFKIYFLTKTHNLTYVKTTFFQKYHSLCSDAMLLSSIVRAQERSSLCANFAYSTAKLKTVTFSGPNSFVITSDKGTNSLSDRPQWKDDGTRNLVGYVSGNKPQVEAIFDMCKDGQYVKAIGKDGTGQEYKFSAQPLIDFSGELTYVPNESDVAFTALKTAYFPNFEITWYLSDNSNGTWTEIGKSSNTIYVTHKKPLQSDRIYHKVIHIGCEKANGESDPEEIIKKSYSEYTDRSVSRMNSSTPIQYWGSWATTDPTTGPYASLSAFKTEGLFEHDDGRCGSWADFFRLVGETQGIPNVKGVRIEWQENTPKIVRGGNTYPGMTDANINLLNADFKNKFGSQQTLPSVIGSSANIYVKNWCFTSGRSFYLYEKTPSITMIGTTSLNPCENTGIAAQSNSDPKSEFPNHAIVEYNAKFYDPSYGTDNNSTRNANEWENVSLDGFGTDFPYMARDENSEFKDIILIWIKELNIGTQQTTFTNY